MSDFPNSTRPRPHDKVRVIVEGEALSVGTGGWMKVAVGEMPGQPKGGVLALPLGGDSVTVEVVERAVNVPVVVVTQDGEGRTVADWYENEDGYYVDDPIATATLDVLHIRRHCPLDTASVVWRLYAGPSFAEAAAALATHTVAEAGAPLEPVVRCDGTRTCPEEDHRPTCLGLYRTEQEVRLSVLPSVEVLERRRADELQVRAHARAVSTKYGGGPDAA